MYTTVMHDSISSSLYSRKVLLPVKMQVIPDVILHIIHEISIFAIFVVRVTVRWIQSFCNRLTMDTCKDTSSTTRMLGDGGEIISPWPLRKCLHLRSCPQGEIVSPLPTSSEDKWDFFFLLTNSSLASRSVVFVIFFYKVYDVIAFYPGHDSTPQNSLLFFFPLFLPLF